MSNVTNSPRLRPKPLSPHLSIYRFQIAMLTSILHRMTGAYLYVGLVVMVWALIGGLFMEETGTWALPSWLPAWIGKIIVLSWVVSFYYHLLNGIRHLYWDIGKGFELKTMRATGIAVFIGTVVLTLLSWWLACPVSANLSM